MGSRGFLNWPARRSCRRVPTPSRAAGLRGTGRLPPTLRVLAGLRATKTGIGLWRLARNARTLSSEPGRTPQTPIRTISRGEKKPGHARFFPCDSQRDQLRSARAVRLPGAIVSADVVDELPLAPIVLPLPALPPAVLLLPAVLPEAVLSVVLPLMPLPEPAAVLPPAGVPVLPMGVSWVLRWPAPMGALGEVGFGGVLCANAAPAIAKAARPANRPLKGIDAVISGTP